ncbi:hypothetical protein BD779DRAFT_1678071 [Infundibulicybe gibba]|nr:hypothetical protein BD779DRAFT_1678071 [Infundibulicybe gibba]
MLSLTQHSVQQAGRGKGGHEGTGPVRRQEVWWRAMRLGTEAERPVFRGPANRARVVSIHRGGRIQRLWFICCAEAFFLAWTAFFLFPYLYYLLYFTAPLHPHPAWPSGLSASDFLPVLDLPGAGASDRATPPLLSFRLALARVLAQSHSSAISARWPDSSHSTCSLNPCTRPSHLFYVSACLGHESLVRAFDALITTNFSR